MSTTVTVNMQLPMLPLPSLAVQVTVVGPNANVLPEGGVHIAGSGPTHASSALAAP